MTWRIFFGSMVSAFTLNVVLSTYHGQPGIFHNYYYIVIPFVYLVIAFVTSKVNWRMTVF